MKIRKKLKRAISKVSEILREKEIPHVEVTSSEVIKYFSGGAPSGDVTDLSDLLDNKWLLIHELLEISELKRKGFTISSDLLASKPREIYRAHVFAFEWELRLAKRAGDRKWIKRRKKLVKSWIKDEQIPEDAKKRCENILKEYKSLHTQT